MNALGTAALLRKMASSTTSCRFPLGVGVFSNTNLLKWREGESMLEAKAKRWFGNQYVLFFQGRPRGTFSTKWLSESLTIHLLGENEFELRKPSMFKSRFLLVDTQTGDIYGEAAKAAFLSTKWKVQLSIGEAVMFPVGALANLHKVTIRGQEIARSHKHWFFNRWKVTTEVDLTFHDQLLIGLINHIIGERRGSDD
jgi:hypothetical protein